MTEGGEIGERNEHQLKTNSGTIFLSIHEKKAERNV